MSVERAGLLGCRLGFGAVRDAHLGVGEDDVDGGLGPMPRPPSLTSLLLQPSDDLPPMELQLIRQSSQDEAVLREIRSGLRSFQADKRKAEAKKETEYKDQVRREEER